MIKGTETVDISSNAGNIKGASEENAINMSHLKTAARIRICRYATLILFFAVVVFGMVIYSDEITTDNINYLMRYLDINVSLGGETSRFEITSDRYTRYGYYKNNIAVLNKDAFNIYALDGQKVFSQSIIFSRPILESANRYILAYDLGGSKLNIYNNFACIYQLDTDKIIYSAHITEEGRLIYVTSDSVYRSEVTVTDKNFSPVFVWRTPDKYIVDACYDENNGRVYIAAYTAPDGEYESDLFVFDVTKKDYISKNVESEAFPIGIWVNDSGFAILFDNRINFYTSDGVLVNSSPAAGLFDKFTSNGRYLAVYNKTKTDFTEGNITVFDSNGVRIREAIINITANSLLFSNDDERLYITAVTGLYYLDINTGEIVFADDSGGISYGDIIFAEPGRVILAGDSFIGIIKDDK